MDSIERVIAAVRSIISGENPVATLLALFCIYLAADIRYWRKRAKEVEEKNDRLHEQIEKYLSLGWQLTARSKGSRSRSKD